MGHRWGRYGGVIPTGRGRPAFFQKWGAQLAMKIFPGNFDFFTDPPPFTYRRYYFSKKFFPGNFDNFSKVNDPNHCTNTNISLILPKPKLTVEVNQLRLVLVRTISLKGNNIKIQVIIAQYFNYLP